jgi:hypothetical protein
MKQFLLLIFNLKILFDRSYEQNLKVAESTLWHAKFSWLIFKDSVCTSHLMLADIIMETNYLMMFREIIDFLSEIHMQKRYVSGKKESLWMLNQMVHTTATCINPL